MGGWWCSNAWCRVTLHVCEFPRFLCCLSRHACSPLKVLFLNAFSHESVHAGCTNTQTLTQITPLRKNNPDHSSHPQRPPPTRSLSQTSPPYCLRPHDLHLALLTGFPNNPNTGTRGKAMSSAHRPAPAGRCL